MNELTPEQQQLLQDVVCGDRERDDPEVVAARREPAFAAALDGVSAVAERLSAAARTEREVFADVRVVPVATRSRWPLIGLAAAVLLGLGLWSWSRGPRAPEYLGGTVPIAVLAADYELFAIGTDPPAGGWFEVTVTDDGGVTVLPATRLTTRQWRPPVELRPLWPEPIVVRVRMFDGQGDLQGDGSLRSWRQSRR
jgi:hypothetical protein